MFLIGFPLLLVPFAIYNIVAFLMPGVSWSGTLATVHMKSGADWTISGADPLLTLAILLLFVEIVKVVRLGRRSIVDHGLALLLFLGMLAEFVLVRQAAIAIFFLLLVLSFFDVVGGIMLPWHARRREVVIQNAAPAHAAVEQAPAPAAPAPTSAALTASTLKGDEPAQHTPS